MLNNAEIRAARQYNEKAAESVFGASELPPPWKGGVIEGSLFAWITAAFQCESGLEVDGCMGPQTWARVRASMCAREDTPIERPRATKRAEYSNAIIVNDARILLPDDLLAAGVTATNFEDDGEPKFKHRERRGEVLNFVIHETCGNTAKGCKNSLARKGYGVQLILAPNGHLSCHGDLVLDRMVHANQLNEVSFGCEVVNPYSPSFVKNKAIWGQTIPAQWWTWVPKGAIRRYVLPTEPQMRAMRVLAPWLCRITGVPYEFPTARLNRFNRKIKGWDEKPKAKPGPGVVCHRDFAGHADGRYILEDLIRIAG